MRFAVVALLLFSTLVLGQERSRGETLYLPIWHGDIGRDGRPTKTLMSVSVSIRNTDPSSAIRMTSALYYDTDGKKLKEYVTKPNTIGPMGTEELFIARSDDRGGSGANFVIVWSADAPVSPPIVEAVHANLPGGRSIVFTTSARRIPQ
jgi:uncharacterized protein DUF3124